MKKQLIHIAPLFLLFFLISSKTEATVWRVNNTDGVKADFTELYDTLSGKAFFPGTRFLWEV